MNQTVLSELSAQSARWEDVPTGLIPMRELGAAAGVKTQAIDALVQLAQNMTGKDFAAEGRTLERLGLNDMGATQIRRAMDKDSVSQVRILERGSISTG